MSSLTRTCPHCLTNNSAFQSVAEVPHTNEKTKFTVFYYCKSCDNGAAATIHQKALGKSPHNYPASLDESPNHVVFDFYPNPPKIEIPEHLPDNLINFFRQARTAFTSNSWDASAMMSRKVIETTAKTLDPDFSGKLYERIDHLSEKHIITEHMKEWAHEIRLEANIAAHDTEEFDQQSAEDLISFAELFLMYTFALPGTLDERRKADSSEDET